MERGAPGAAHRCSQCWPLSAIGIDTWAVDYGLVARCFVHPGPRLPLGTYPGVLEQVSPGSPQEAHAINGLQVQDFNTLFQLMAQDRDDGLPRV